MASTPVLTSARGLITCCQTASKFAGELRNDSGLGPDKIAIQKAKLAMALRGKSAHRELDRIKTRHWRVLADQSGLIGAFEAMQDLVDRVPSAIAHVETSLPRSFPEAVWESIAKGMQRQRERFIEGINDV